jgi:cellulose 1,4-beta-cellobiosidase
MDIWEANSISAAYTPHPCSKDGLYACSSPTECGDGDNRYSGVCDKDGCDFNSYRQGNTSFYGPGKIVNSNSKFTVVTKFITKDGTDTGPLKSIQRLYVQNGKVIQNSVSDIKGIPATNEITKGYCKKQKKVFGDTDSFDDHGGLKTMGDAFDDGMVLVLSIWDDYTAQMLWLDAPYPATADPSKPGVSRGTCAADSGAPGTVESQYPNSQVIFSNIKFGALGSTYSH